MDLGQVIMTGIEGVTLRDEERNFITSHGIGGVLLFEKNFHTLKELVALVESIQRAAKNYPLFIAVDQEGGRVLRFKAPFTPWPSMGDLGLENSPDLCAKVCESLARELVSCGINVNLAPVCDIPNGNGRAIGDRAFGKSEALVSRLVPAALEGFCAGGVLSCLKHFPGHGATALDSHVELPLVEKNMEELRAREFVPFRRGVSAGANFVMMAHLLVPSIDPKFPTSLSPKAYELLRRELAFNGPIITDDMQMGAVTKQFSPEDRALMAIKAGADVIEYRDIHEAQRAHGALQRALESGELESGYLEEKIRRVVKLKKSTLIPKKTPSLEEAERTVGAKNYKDLLSK